MKREIIIVDDHKALLLGVKNFLQGAGFSVTQTYNSLQEAEAILADGQSAGKTVLCDLQFGREYSFDFIKKLAAAKIKCIVYSMYESEYFILKAFDAGAFGYCFKSEDMNTIAEAVDFAEQGKRYLPQTVSADFINATSVYAGFTKKERLIADFVMQGKSNKEIAEALDVSYRTVESYLQRLYTKAGVGSRFDLERVLCKR